MRKINYALMLPLVVISGLVFANHAIKNDSAYKLASTPNKKAHPYDLKKWEASPDGLKYKKWETSSEGKKAYASADKIRKHIKDFTDMEAVVTSISHPHGPLDGFRVMVRINDEAYIVNFWPEKTDWNFTNFNNDFWQLNSLKVNDKIIIRSHSAGYSGKSPYVILTGDYLERDNILIFKREDRNSGC